MNWITVFPSTFKNGYRKHKLHLQNKADAIIREMSKSNNPKGFGRKKRGTIKNCYGIDLSSDCRILFAILDFTKEIHFLRMCKHKDVYANL